MSSCTSIDGYDASDQKLSIGIERELLFHIYGRRNLKSDRVVCRRMD
ncbi:MULTISPECIES: hypothetical protein [Eubacterium]|nr:MULTISPECIES: hypothetical protein [Eubacterium]MBS6339511.1 hypothetical protein [Eubacterium limosum]